MSTRKKIRLGDLLIRHKIISQKQLEQALEEQKNSGRKLGHILTDSGYATEEQILGMLSAHLKIPFIPLKQYKFDPSIIKRIPEIQARRLRAVALKDERDSILIGMSDPTNIFAYDELSKIVKKPIRLAIVRESELLKMIDTVYRKTEEIFDFAGALDTELSQGEVDLDQLLATEGTIDAPVVKLLNSLFEDAMQINASDVHIEPDEEILRIRQRVDGVLQEHIIEEKRIASALVLKLKLMAGLNISEKRLPQDGRFSVKLKEKKVDIRLSTMPVEYGESVVMRLLDQSGKVLDLASLGMSPALLKRFKSLIGRSNGMLLVTGPTGSGKTTTLYAALHRINTPERKIITVEDPVEYRLPRINQVQVNSRIGLNFATILRTVLRQDPDVILVGEMRDNETAEIGLRAAMTGHMVLSTLHTSDAISTVNRLIDMGIKDYLLAAALHAILAQRLVRRICKSCIQVEEIDEHIQAWLAGSHNIARQDNAQFHRGEGCAHCNYSGYQGRVGVYELLTFDKQLTEVLSHDGSAAFCQTARGRNFPTLNQSAFDYACKGITSIEEVVKLSEDIDVWEQGAEQASQVGVPSA